MDSTAIQKLLEDLIDMAANLLSQDQNELRKQKKELDAYVEAVKAKMTGASKEVAGREFEKCRVCAREWIKVYSDAIFDGPLKKDILREDAGEFFFTVDERIIAVQKKFFLLGMLDEVTSPSDSFSKEQREAIAARTKIRMLARDMNLKPTYKTTSISSAMSGEMERLWFFGDERNSLQSSEEGLTDQAALDYLLSKAN
jgi:hypothetical protein